jgi:putative hydrolase of the HAD superfamily
MTLTTRVAGALFDLDDTLLDRHGTVVRYLGGQCARFSGLAGLYDAYTNRFHELDANGWTDRATLFAALSAEFPSIGSAEDLADDFRKFAWTDCVLMDRATDVLRELRSRGVRLGIVTNGSSEMQRAKLNHSGLLGFVDFALVSGEEGVAKPNAEIFHRATRRLGLAPQQVMFVGDNPRNDVDGARGAGLLPVWLRHELPWPGEIEAPGFMITSLGELIQARTDS